MRDRGMPLHDVLDYGPIMAHDTDSGCLVTVNGAYFNLWVPVDGERTHYENTDCRSPGCLPNRTFGNVQELAQAKLEDWLKESESGE